MTKKKPTADYLQEMLNKHGSAKAMSEEVGLAPVTIYQYLKLYGIVAGKKVASRIKFDNLDKTILIEKYLETGSAKETAKYFGVSPDQVLNFLPDDIKIPGGRYLCNDAAFDVDSEASFYYAGYLAADGCLHLKDGKYKQVSMALHSKDRSVLESLKKFLDFEGPISDYEFEKTQRSDMTISSSKLFDSLARFNLGPRKSLTLQFPQWMINHPLAHHFIRGYVDGDGSFWREKPKNKAQQIHFSVISTLSFLEDIRKILIANGVVPDKEKKIRCRGKIYQLEYGGNRIVKKIHDYLYRDATIYLARKKAVAEEALVENKIGGWKLRPVKYKLPKSHRRYK